MYRLADLIEKNTDELAALETLDNGKPIRDVAGRRPAAGDRLLPLLRRLGRQDPRQDDPDPRRLLLLHAARAGRRGRADHPVELPDADGGVEVGPGAGGRLHDRDEAGRADAADRAAHGRAGPGGGLPRRRHQHRPRLRPDRRRAPSSSTWTSTRSPSPARPKSASSSWRRPRDRTQARHARAGRQEPEHRLRRRRPGRGRRRARTSACSSTRASAAAPAAGCSSRRRSTTSSSRRCRAGARRRSVGDPFDPKTDQGPQVEPGAVRQGHELHRRRQAARAPSCSPAASASATRATSSSRRCSPT